MRCIIHIVNIQTIKTEYHGLLEVLGMRVKERRESYEAARKVLKASNASILRCKLNNQTVLKVSNKS